MNSESEIQNSKSKIRNSASADALVEVRGLKKYFPVTSGAIARRVVGWVKAVDDVSFSIRRGETLDRKSTRLNSSHGYISYAVFCLKKKKTRESAAGALRAAVLLCCVGPRQRLA